MLLKEQNEKTLKDHIENRVANLTRKPKCPIRRAVLLLYDNNVFISNIIKSLDVHDNGLDYVAFDGEKNVVSALQNQLNIYKVKIDNRELYCPAGIYVLIALGNNQYLKETTIQGIHNLLTAVFIDVMVEFCILKNPEDEWSDSESDSVITTNNKVWIIDYNLPATLQLLLDNARYAKETFGENVGKEMKTCPLYLRLDESNAIRQEISETFLKAIRMQTVPRNSSEIRNDIIDYLFTKEYRRQLIKQVPSMDWLPILGYESLVKKLDRENQSISFWKRFSRRFNPQPIESQITTAEVLDILFASMGNQIRTESIRQSIREKVIPNICNTFLEDIKPDLVRIISQKFSVHDIVYELRNHLLTLKQEVQHDIEKNDENIDKILDAKFSYMNTEIESIFFGLSEYFSEFEHQCKEYVRSVWWETLADFVNECQEIARTNSKEFLKAETVFMLSMIDEHVTLGTNSASTITITDMNDLINKLNHYSTNTSLTLTDILSVIKVKDKSYSKTADYHVNKDEQPRIYMIVPSKFSNDIDELNGVKNSLDLSWEFIFEDYIPSQLSYQIRVYNWAKGGNDRG